MASPPTICNFPLGMFQELGGDILYLALCSLPCRTTCRREERRRDEINLGQSPSFLPRQGNRRFSLFFSIFYARLPIPPSNGNRIANEPTTRGIHSYPWIACQPRSTALHGDWYITLISVMLSILLGEWENKMEEYHVYLKENILIKLLITIKLYISL